MIKSKETKVRFECVGMISTFLFFLFNNFVFSFVRETFVITLKDLRTQIEKSCL